MRGELIAACHSWAVAAGSPLIRLRAELRHLPPRGKALQNQTWNSSAISCSFSSEPITQSLPVDIGATGADLMLAGNHIELIPCVAAVHDALGAQDHAVSTLVQRVQRLVEILAAVLVGRLLAPAGEHLIGIMVVVVAAAADAMLIVVMLMMVVILIMVMMAAMLMVVVILVMIVMAAMLVVVLILVMVMMAAMLVVMLVLVMVVMAAMLVVMLVLIMVMMVVVMLLLTGMCLVGGAGLVQQLGHKVALAVHDRDDLGAGQGGPVCGDDGGGGVLLGQQATAAATLSSPAFPVRLRMMQEAWLTDRHRTRRSSSYTS